VKEADRIEEDCLYSAKSQWEAARGLGWLHLALGIPATIAAALAGVSIATDDKAIGALLAVATAVLTGLLTFLDPKGKANLHRDAGAAYKAISNDARIFREISCVGDTAIAELEGRLEALNKRRNESNSSSPQPGWWAFRRAKKGIERGDAKYRIETGKSR
jgi:hypothetical protein